MSAIITMTAATRGVVQPSRRPGRRGDADAQYALPRGRGDEGHEHPQRPIRALPSPNLALAYRVAAKMPAPRNY